MTIALELLGGVALACLLMKGEWKDHRDCHIKPDLILLYRKPNSDTLELVRLGSHSELSL